MVSVVNIRPGVSILSVLPHLNYKPWFALAELVDNALQSYQANIAPLPQLGQRTLRVQIQVETENGGRIIVRDNAAGISIRDFPRAFRPAEVPPDSTGLSEFGMGMKSAACWFGRRWSVRTSALGEAVERTVRFDIDTIVGARLEELSVEEVPARERDHYTEIVIERLNKPPVGRTIGKIKEHLADIYRIFLRNQTLAITVNGDELAYEEPEILVAPYFANENSPAIRWYRELDITLPDGKRASGFAAIRARASTSRAGFALFRRGRLIQGSGDEGYRPERVFGKSNSYYYQRIFGELHLEGFEVSHTKDGFRWDESEEPLLDRLRTELSRTDFPLMQQANGFRARPRREEVMPGVVKALDSTVATIQSSLAPIANSLAEQPPINEVPVTLPDRSQLSEREFRINFRGDPWVIAIEITDDPSVGDWLEISDAPVYDSEQDARRLRIRFALNHPFTARFSGIEADEIEPMIRMASALALAEVIAREGGVSQAGTIRRNVNELLRYALSRP